MNNRKQRILFYAPAFYSLHEQIISELKRKGFIVDFLEDRLQAHNPFFKSSSFTSLKKLYYRFTNPNLKYLKSKKCIFDEKFYDYFLCINGYSFHPYLIQVLKKNNPHIKSILYIWDGFSFFDFRINLPYFDRKYTFDLEDANRYKIDFLSLFWVEDKLTIDKLEYDLFFVGTLHSDRYEILKKIEAECVKHKVKCYLKIIYRKSDVKWIDYLRYFYYYFKKAPNAISFKKEFQILNGKLHASFLQAEAIPIETFTSLMNQSKCILDVELPYQTGITNRMITALAMKKKIITTNYNVKKYPFYNKENILIINRSSPVLSLDFLKGEYQEGEHDIYLSSLRIDNWVNQLLY